MKTLIKIGVLMIMVTFFATSCKKDPGSGGKKEIKGTVTYPGGVAEGAVVTIAYDAKEPSETIDEQVTSDASGMYTISELRRGDYFVDAYYIDQYGVKYNTPGYYVLIDKKKGEVALDIILE